MGVKWIGRVNGSDGKIQYGFIEQVPGGFVLTFAWEKGNVWADNGLNGALCSRSDRILQEVFEIRLDRREVLWSIPRCRVIGFRSRWKSLQEG
ncbi:MAG: hypothetical protein K0Q73_7238 [Paenibacillus sp.]|jgi:hypothetical protein|nr:hypothetical protein [Paenibacillus sp.]